MDQLSKPSTKLNLSLNFSPILLPKSSNPQTAQPTTHKNNVPCKPYSIFIAAVHPTLIKSLKAFIQFILSLNPSASPNQLAPLLTKLNLVGHI
jgi:hypothetical protein